MKFNLPHARHNLIILKALNVLVTSLQFLIHLSLREILKLQTLTFKILKNYLRYCEV